MDIKVQIQKINDFVSDYDNYARISSGAARHLTQDQGAIRVPDKIVSDIYRDKELAFLISGSREDLELRTLLNSPSSDDPQIDLIEALCRMIIHFSDLTSERTELWDAVKGDTTKAQELDLVVRRIVDNVADNVKRIYINAEDTLKERIHQTVAKFDGVTNLATYTLAGLETMMMQTKKDSYVPQELPSDQASVYKGLPFSLKMLLPRDIKEYLRSFR